MSNQHFVFTADEWDERLRDALPPTSDDVCVTNDGRRLDTPAKLIAFLNEINAQRVALDDGLVA